MTIETLLRLSKNPHYKLSEKQKALLEAYKFKEKRITFDDIKTIEDKPHTVKGLEKIREE
jgi:hypothetical protein